MKSSATFADDFRLYRRLLGYAWRYQWVFPIALFGMLLMAATGTGFAAVMKPLVDEGFIQRNVDTIRLAPLWLLLLFLGRSVATFIAEYSTAWIGRGVIRDVRRDCFDRLLKLPCGFYDLNPSSRLVAKLIFDVEQVAGAVTQGLIVVIGDGLTALALLGYLFYLNWKLTLLLLVVAPITMLLVQLMSRGFRRRSEKIQVSIGDISRVVQEATEGYRVIKAFGGEAREIEIFAATNQRNRKQVMRKAALASGGMGVVQFVSSIGMAVMIHVALGDPAISAGVFVSFIAATTWLMGPMRRLAKINEVIQTGMAAAKSAFALIDEPVEPDDATRTLERVRGRIEYRNVSHRYATAENEALRDVSFVIEPGQTVALVGSSGSGKTSLASLLPRFYRVSSGEILLDGVNINELVLANLRKHISLVGQDTLLFNDTIADNIVYGSDAPIDRVRLREAARAAHVLDFAERLPQGLDMPVGERGALLSGGQRQRVAIARALYKDAPILVLDEATAALDTESERLVQDAMRRLRANRTTLVIAHRLSTVEHADRIVVLARGQVIETGMHHELLARNGAYANLYRLQFADTDAG
ncbi:MAG TPA: lipid A export permease/ATP-binding protein MsbA [Burkholderiales bacterium]|nr:lipid A export permease/ATP-binding protein MsbA [Burkholderiales bacterium]